MGFLSKKIFRLYAVYGVFLLVNIFFHNLAFAQNGINISGFIIDSHTKLPLQGVSIRVSDTKNSVFSNKEGKYSISVQGQSKSLIFSIIGYKNKTIVISKDLSELNVDLEPESKDIDEIVVTGMFDRKRESFSGSTKTISGEQIRSIGNKNVLQALKSLDPSISFLDNNLSGSDPNSMARIELRGKTSVTSNTNYGTFRNELEVDPNMPLFILDGFESSLRQITDLDINRILSVTTLKDAASTALYGAKSANGVIVVETIKPKPGELRLTYSSDYSFNIADLSDYNLMNAAEKLEYERLAGRFEGGSTWDKYALNQFYNSRLKEITKGVDTYWLTVPLNSIGVENRHSLQAFGGSDEFQYNIGGNFQNINGVMKGSGRKNWGGNIDLTYRKDKFNITNKMYVSGNRSDESPYGSFSTFAKVNPYYKKDNSNSLYLEEAVTGYDRTRRIENPMYNSSLNSEEYGTLFNVQNNLALNYDFNTNLRFTGVFQVSKGVSNNIQFISPEHTQFEGQPLLRKGTYTDISGNSSSYSANIASTYSQTFSKKHVLTSNFRVEISESNSNSKEFVAMGFPLGVEGNPAFAYSYLNDSRPFISNPPTIRRISALGSANYFFDNRYFLDATYRIEGSTAFGTANKYSPFWAIGLGWSVHNEAFLKDNEIINRFVLRGNVGTNGNQSFGSFLSTTVYNLYPQINYFGLGLSHNSLSNPNLDWQNTFQTSLGMELNLLNNRLSLNFNAYQKVTSPLIISITLPESNGATSYPMNMGQLTTKGFEPEISFRPVMNLDKGITWNIGVIGAIVRSKYSNFESIVDLLNEEQLRSNSIQRYSNGKSPDDIWSFKSIGIDPSSGLEMFLTEEDTYTYDYRMANIRVVGNQRPVVEGRVNTSLRIKNFTASATISYNFGSSRMNHALYEKVENISNNDLDFNQDKRALELRWKSPGDVAQFKAINLLETTPISSRFVQKESIISGESFSLSYEFTQQSHSWLKTVKLNRLNISAYMNDIFRISNILNERGIDYPFARSASFSLRASF